MLAGQLSVDLLPSATTAVGTEDDEENSNDALEGDPDDILVTELAAKDRDEDDDLEDDKGSDEIVEDSDVGSGDQVTSTQEEPRVGPPRGKPKEKRAVSKGKGRADRPRTPPKAKARKRPIHDSPQFDLVLTKRVRTGTALTKAQKRDQDTKDLRHLVFEEDSAVDFSWVPELRDEVRLRFLYTCGPSNRSFADLQSMPKGQHSLRTDMASQPKNYHSSLRILSYIKTRLLVRGADLWA